MAIAFVVTTAETDLVNTLFPDAEYPCADGALFRFRTVDVKPALEALTAFAADAEPGSEEQRAALRLAERLGTWLGRNHVADQVEAVEPPSLDEHLEAGGELLDPNAVEDIDAMFADEAPSPAPKRRRKASAEAEAPVADETAGD